ncbi:hypothetical protein STANM309S_02104 [Streptomyces tanashiensis]
MGTRITRRAPGVHRRPPNPANRPRCALVYSVSPSASCPVARHEYAWIWVEDHSGLFHVPTPFAGMSLAAKTDALADLLGPLLAEYVHVAGIVVSNAARRRLPLPPDENALRPAAQGFQRGLPLDRVRETIVIPRRILLPEQTGLIARMCHAEADALDWALGKLGVPQGVASLLTDSSTPRRDSALWTPRAGRGGKTG